MIDDFYHMLEHIGYDHPLHPAIVHVPVGIVVALFLLSLVSRVFKRDLLPPAAYFPLLVLAFLSALASALLGYADWLYFYQGVMIAPILVKLIITGFLLLLLVGGIFLARRRPGAKGALLAVGLFCLLAVTALGYFGGDLVFRNGEQKTLPKAIINGQKIFGTNCAVCHSDVAMLSDTPPAGSFKTFVAFLRNPSGGMPAFAPKALSNDEAMQIYHFVVRYPCLPRGK